MKRPFVPVVYAVLGTFFTLLGILTLLNVAAAWQTGRVFLWGAAAYAAMDFLIAYGLFKREWWLPHAFALNLAGLAILFLLVDGAQTASSTFYALALGVNALLAAFLYYTHARRKGTSTTGNGAGAAFALLWALMFCYTIVGNFS